MILPGGLRAIELGMFPFSCVIDQGLLQKALPRCRGSSHRRLISELLDFTSTANFIVEENQKSDSRQLSPCLRLFHTKITAKNADPRHVISQNHLIGASSNFTSRSYFTAGFIHY